MRIPSTASPDIQAAFKDVFDVLATLTTKDINLKGRRIVNASSSVEPLDYVTQFEMADKIKGLILDSQPDGSGSFSSGPLAARGSVSGNNSIFYATDTAILYGSVANVWTYLGGVHRGVLSAKPTLTTTDTNYLFFSTDYFHLYRWTGSVWEFGPGDPGSDFIVLTRGDDPKGGLWALCDGSTVTVAQSNATTASVVTPECELGAYVKFGSYTGVVIDPVIPTVSGPTGVPSATTVVQSGTGTTVASETHHHHEGTLVISDTGEPKHIVMTAYLRR